MKNCSEKREAEEGKKIVRNMGFYIIEFRKKRKEKNLRFLEEKNLGIFSACIVVDE
jgi:hypothetical protein